MSAVVVDLCSVLARRKLARHSGHQAAGREPMGHSRGALAHDFTFWRGATGTRYVHTIYPLLECPELPQANVLLVRRHASGRLDVLRICRVENAAMSSNLAEVRHAAAQLDANEVHVHLLARSEAERADIEHDISGCSGTAIAAKH